MFVLASHDVAAALARARRPYARPALIPRSGKEGVVSRIAEVLIRPTWGKIQVVTNYFRMIESHDCEEDER